MIFSDIARYYCYHMIICLSVSPSVRPSVCPACRPPSSNLPSSPPTLLNQQTYIHDTQKCNFSVNFSRNWLNLFSFFLQHISNGFYHVTFRSPSKMVYRWRGAENVISYGQFGKLFVTSVTHQLLHC